MPPVWYRYLWWWIVCGLPPWRNRKERGRRSEFDQWLTEHAED